MLRRTIILPKVTRSWTKSSISAAAHFPNAVKAADPSAGRLSSASAKEQRVWSMEDTDRTTTPYVRQMPKGLQWVVDKTHLYSQLVRFDKPVGTLLLLVPCFWGSSLAVTRAIVWEGADPVVLFAPFVPFHLAFFFVAGAFLMRSAGCIINDMWDRNIDGLVERTKNRPIANGSISLPVASFAVVMHVIPAAAIALNLSPVALATCVASLPLVVIYPFMKRVTYMPQFVLGLAFNWGIFVGYAAVLNRLDLSVTLPIYCGAVIWTILYDTIYAYQDREDDLKCGVKSSAILIGDRKYILSAMVGPVCIGMLVSGLMVSQSLFYYIGIMFATFYLHGVVDHANIYDRWSCGTAFKRNVTFGWMVFASMIAGNAFWSLASEHRKEKDAITDTIKESPALLNFLSMNKLAESRAYSVEDAGWLDRIMHPAYIQAREAVKEGKDPKDLEIPAWMRREYIGENLGTVFRFAGVPDATVVEWQQWWYSMLDHYNPLPPMAL